MVDHTVFIVDDDEGVRDSLALLLQSEHYQFSLFNSAIDFLDAFKTSWQGCLLLDIRMHIMDGLELQAELNKRNFSLPIIFMTGHGDVPMAVQAMKSGALDFLQKPFEDTSLFASIEKAMQLTSTNTDKQLQRQKTLDLWQQLTNREQEVALCIANGQANKVIAIKLGISQRTVEIHRAHAMQKMNCRALADLVRKIIDINLLS